MQFTVSNNIVKRYPSLQIGVITIRGANNVGGSNALKRVQKSVASELKSSFEGVDVLSLPKIEYWRSIYRGFGADPDENRPASQSIIESILNRGFLRQANRVVDLYIAVLAEFMWPIGGYDLDRIDGDIELRYSAGGEYFVPILRHGQEIGSDNEELTASGEVVYADSMRILTRCWNSKDGEYAKITEDSSNVALFVENPDEFLPAIEFSALLRRLADLSNQFCGGEVAIHSLNVKSAASVIL